MPATRDLVIGKWARVRQRAALDGVDLGTGIAILAGLFVIFAAIASVLFWMVTATIASADIKQCFDVIPTCEVLLVRHRLRNISTEGCADVFTYLWTPPDHPVVYFQNEVRPRTNVECQQPLDVGAQNATFQPGIHRCFRLKDIYNMYRGRFNCARASALSNISRDSCETLVEPEGKVNAAVALATHSCILLLKLCFFCDICSSESDE